MKKITVTISEELAELIERQQHDGGHPTLDDAVTELISLGLAVAIQKDEPDDGYSTEELADLLREGDESGPAVPWNPDEVRAEIQRRYLARTRSKR